MHRLRRECPWDAQQTHRSLVTYLIEETYETVEALEAGDDTHLVEELGDLLLQVVFHATIAEEREAFSLDDVATGVADKLIRRHPYVFADGEVPTDLDATWEQRKAAEKGRRSVLEGIPTGMSAMARGAKIISRAASRGVELDLPDEPISEPELRTGLLGLLARAKASDLDPEQALRDVVRDLETTVTDHEGRGARTAAT
ncbi:MazG family protein [Propionibacteriaceae bacterium Y2011]|uniref:MazG family protein n=1 Tax=Microlunatus sp. Y2014 TaxID=3418488 RepID=UPI003B4D00B4